MQGNLVVDMIDPSRVGQQVAIGGCSWETPRGLSTKHGDAASLSHGAYRLGAYRQSMERTINRHLENSPGVTMNCYST